MYVWGNKNIEKGMVQGTNITLGFKLATGKANLNEIVYRLKEINNSNNTRNPFKCHISKTSMVYLRNLLCIESV